jgi:hypothetical protein
MAMYLRTTSADLILFFILVVLTTGCSNSTEDQARKKGVEMFFTETVHDYGEIPEKSEGVWTFSYKNLGKEAIVINRVRSTCGCTIPKWTREPVAPGDTGTVSVKYNTATKGTFMKSLYVYSSAANSPVKLQIKGKVIPSYQDS